MMVDVGCGSCDGCHGTTDNAFQDLRHEPHAPDGRGDGAAGGLDDDGDLPGARVLVEEGEHAWHVWCEGSVCSSMTNAL